MKAVRIILSVCAMLIAIVGAFATKTEVSLASVFTKGSGMCQISDTCTSGSGISCSSSAAAYLNLADCQNNQNRVPAHRK